MKKLSEKFAYYVVDVNGQLKALLPTWVPLYAPTGSAFFLTARGNPSAPEDTTFYLKER